MLGFLSLGLIWFFWINLVFWFNLGFITLEGVVFPPMDGTESQFWDSALLSTVYLNHRTVHDR